MQAGAAPHSDPPPTDYRPHHLICALRAHLDKAPPLPVHADHQDHLTSSTRGRNLWPLWFNLVQNMKQEKTRIQIPLTGETRAMLQAYADATGSTLARTCSQVLQETAPVMFELSKSIGEARKAPARAIREATELLDRQIADSKQLALDVSFKATDGRRKKKAS